MDVGSWLRSLELEQYEALFRENDIDAEVLGDLTDADLEKLGVTLGHRKRAAQGDRQSGCHGASREADDPCALTPVNGRCRAPSDHGDVLRSCRLDKPCCEA